MDRKELLKKAVAGSVVAASAPALVGAAAATPTKSAPRAQGITEVDLDKELAFLKRTTSTKVDRFDAVRRRIDSSRQLSASEKKLLILGYAFHMAGDYARSARFFLAATDANSSNAEAWARLAIAHLKLGNPKSGLDAALRAQKLSPNGTFRTPTADLEYSVATVVGQAYAFNGQLADAEKALLPAVQPGSKDTFAATTLGFVQFRRGNFTSARKSLSSAMRLGSNVEPAVQADLQALGRTDTRAEAIAKEALLVP